MELIMGWWFVARWCLLACLPGEEPPFIFVSPIYTTAIFYKEVTPESRCKDDEELFMATLVLLGHRRAVTTGCKKGERSAWEQEEEFKG